MEDPEELEVFADSSEELEVFMDAQEEEEVFMDALDERDFMEEPEEQEVFIVHMEDPEEQEVLMEDSEEEEEVFMDDPEEEEAKFKCLHDREEFYNLDDFHGHNKECHKRFKKTCKECHNVFRDHKKLKAHVKEYHDYNKMNYVCLHDGRCFESSNAFQLHNSDCHKKFHRVCSDKKCLNDFRSDHIVQINSVQEHPMGRLRHRKCSK